MNREELEEKIKWIKDTFERKLSYELNLLRVSGPIFVEENSKINDDLGGVNAVSFKNNDGNSFEVVQSLAKWKRMRLYDFDSSKYSGIYVDMNAIRPNEEVDYLHSYYVDQWDWEKIITKEQRNIAFLEYIVSKIHKVINSYFDNDKKYNNDLFFITSQELYEKYPDLTPKEREYEIVKEHGAVFIEKIGWPLTDLTPHDLRADDYDDWNLNGDLLYWSDAINGPIEISSMGIRVDKKSLENQIQFSDNLNKLNYKYHKMILKDELPLTIGGGIGQSRLCMLILGKRHIGEVQSSWWPENEKIRCQEEKINLL